MVFRNINNRFVNIISIMLMALVSLLVMANGARATRIKDIANFEGMRKNQLVGYGIVVGLNGSGDGKKARFTLQSMVNMLEKMGVTVNESGLKFENVAAVMVTAELPPFGRVGSKIDVLVSSIGDASSLEGGTLLLTPLKGADGNVYAIAQGPVNTGGFSAGGTSAAVQKNFPTVGRVADGATIEREISYNFNGKNVLALALHRPDFTTVSRVADKIDTALNGKFTKTPDAGTVQIIVPDQYIGNIVRLVTKIESLGVIPDVPAKVVINERTGTVVMGDQVRISTVAIAHGNLSIAIQENYNVSQPGAFARTGRTVVTPETDISVSEEDNRLIMVEEGVSIGEVVRALNALGVSPRDLIAIFQAIKAAGALQASLEVI